MSITCSTPRVLIASAVILAFPVASKTLAAQGNDSALVAGLKVVKLLAEPANLTLRSGETARFKVTALDADGKPVKALIRFGAPRGALRVTDSTVTALSAGKHEIMAMVLLPGGANRQPPMLTIPAVVAWPSVTTVSIKADNGKLYAGTTLGHHAVAKHADSTARPAPTVRWTSSNPAVATVDRFGYVTAVKPGMVTITAAVEEGKGEQRYTIAPYPVSSIDVQVSEGTLRTGDVVTLKAVAKGRGGVTVTDAPITWSFTYIPDDSVAAPGATGAIDGDRFVAEVAGTYTIVATTGPISGRKTIDVRPREVVQRILPQGQGSIRHVHTADLWTFPGKDGRDYALVGTWGGDGWTYIFDITNPGSIVKTDSVKVDARTINDVTVSPDSRYGALSREGASNRVNGVVILDLKNPAHPTIASTFDQNLTGGVHNMFATNDHLFALSAGDKYVIIDVKDITKPTFVSEYDHPNSRIHDVWVHDGIAYSSEWDTGVVAVDVGNGKYGGTIEKPKLINSYSTKSGRTHEVFPYVQKSTGKVYIFLGDEIMSRRGKVWEGVDHSITAPGGKPQTMAGYTHIIDFTDPKNPKNVARYEQPEFGSHDIIVENDILYQAYYDGGLRVVDVSGELLGNIATQQREIAVFKPYDPQGYTANAPMVMNAMPYKGHVFFTDFNSGLWAAKLEPKAAVVP